jgi:hypothetical protein
MCFILRYGYGSLRQLFKHLNCRSEFTIFEPTAGALESLECG